MRRRYYIEQFNYIWSFSLEGYKLFLENGAAGKEWDLDDPRYNSSIIKNKPQKSANPINPIDFSSEDFQEEIEYSLKSGKQSGKRIDPHSMTTI